MAAKTKKPKKGALHKMLGIPLDQKIPFTLLEEIRVTEIGKRAHNPTQIGHKIIKVTKLLKARAVRGLNWKRVTQRRTALQ